MTLVKACIWYHAGSLMWYAANSLTIPTAVVQVPKVLDERGVAGEAIAGLALSLTWLDERRPGYRR
jgi:hypothetical protein